MSNDTIARIRGELAKTDAAGAVLSTQDNIFYASAFASVMDGWHLMEPIAAVFVPTDSALLQPRGRIPSQLGRPQTRPAAKTTACNTTPALKLITAGSSSLRVENPQEPPVPMAS